MPKKWGEYQPGGTRAPVEPGESAQVITPDGARRAKRTETGKAPGSRGVSSGSSPIRPGSSFAARFGRVILQHGIAAIPSALFHYQGKLKLSAQQVWFVSYVLSHKWDEDLPYPSLKKMERCTGICERHLRRVKSGLCQRGLLSVHARYGEQGRRDTDAYDFAGLFGRMEKLIIADAPTPNPIQREEPLPTGAEIAGELDPSFIARYGRVLTRRGVAAVPRALFTHQAALSLTPQHVWFVSYIFSFQWDTSLPYPSIRRMAATTAYSSVQLHNIKRELVEAGYLRLVHRRDEQGGQDTNAYDFSGLLDAIRLQLQQDAPVMQSKPILLPEEDEDEPAPRRGRRVLPAVGQLKPDIEDNSLSREGDSYFTGVGDAQFIGYGDSGFTGPGDQNLSVQGDQQLPGVGDKRLAAPGKGKSAGKVTRVLSGRGTRTLHEIESYHVEENKDDSNRTSQQNENADRIDTGMGSKRDKQITTTNPVTPKYSPYIAALASDFSGELGDSAHEASNMRQAINLWQASGLGESEFVAMMQEARKLTRKYQGRPTWDVMHNKMAYFFTTLRDLCGNPPGPQGHQR
jgi:hypothetical protein